MRRRCIREQLQYIRRNLGHILALFDCIGCLPSTIQHRFTRRRLLSWPQRSDLVDKDNGNIHNIGKGGAGFQ